MRELVFLLEERSAKALLESLLPRVLTRETPFRCIPFEGKQDMEKQLPLKIRAYRNERARFIVLRDQDSASCKVVKKKLLDLCAGTGKEARCVVRIACRELEAFYLADLQAVDQALGIGDLARRQKSRKFRAPDSLGSPAHELKMLTRSRYEKVAGSRAIGRCLSIDNDRSPSFRNLIAAIRRMESELAAEA